LLGVVNRLARALQRWRQGIPFIGAVIYRRVAMSLMRRVHRVVAEHVARSLRGGSVVDVGCGTGDLLIQLADFVKGLRELICLDISRAMAEIARRELVGRGRYSLVDIVIGDAHRLPLRSRSIDIVTCVGTLHHLKNPTEFLQRCASTARTACLVYEFSHDVPTPLVDELRRELGEKVPRWLLKLVAALHGIPRNELEKLVESLGIDAAIESIGPLTVIAIETPPRSAG